MRCGATRLQKVKKKQRDPSEGKSGKGSYPRQPKGTRSQMDDLENARESNQNRKARHSEGKTEQKKWGASQKERVKGKPFATYKGKNNKKHKNSHPI